MSVVWCSICGRPWKCNWPAPVTIATGHCCRLPTRKRVLRELMAVRDPLYREVAHHIIPTASGNLRKVADLVLDRLHEHEA